MYSLIKSLLFRYDPEVAHEKVTSLFVSATRMPGAEVLTSLFRYSHPALVTRVAGILFPNPIGLAAGFDKNATMITAMRHLGFGYVEVGTVTPRPQEGNPKPRLFRLPEDHALINRMGFNGEGAEVVRARLSLAPRALPIGVNIGKNKITPLEDAADDYVQCFTLLAPLADYVTINVSSPNTPGLRQLQERNALKALLRAIAGAKTASALSAPIFLKISPDETNEELDQVLDVAKDAGIDGIILTNTTISRPETLQGIHKAETGGLSGPPVRRRATEMIRRAFRATGGALPIIGVGGIDSAASAYEKILAGASLLQIYTGLIYDGPSLVSSILKGMVPMLERDGFASIADAVGKDIR